MGSGSDYAHGSKAPPLTSPTKLSATDPERTTPPTLCVPTFWNHPWTCTCLLALALPLGTWGGCSHLCPALGVSWCLSWDFRLLSAHLSEILSQGLCRLPPESYFLSSELPMASQHLTLLHHLNTLFYKLLRAAPGSFCPLVNISNQQNHDVPVPATHPPLSGSCQRFSRAEPVLDSLGVRLFSLGVPGPHMREELLQLAL